MSVGCTYTRIRETYDFTLPNINQGSKAAFSTMDRWWIEYFENVKALEEDTDIDSINFYRDPYKE